MGNTETEATSKPIKVLPQQEQVAIPSYSDWSAMQAYYGPGVGIPPPYFTSAVVPAHASHPYVWGPQPMMSPYGATYPAFAAYSHPPLPLGPVARSQGNTSTVCEAATVAAGTENSAKLPTNNKDCGLMKKLKGFDGLVVSTSNGNHDNRGSSFNSQSQSEEDIDGSSNGSEENSEGSPPQKKRGISADVPSKSKKGKERIESSNVSSTISLSVAVGHPGIIGRTAAVTAALPKAEIDLGVKSKPVAGSLPLTSTAIIPIHDAIPPNHWMQDERELKRERRKQSNRESARRSRLRKQAETEELALKVENLTSEKSSLQSEISRLLEMSEKLRRENSVLMEKLRVLEGNEPTAMQCERDPKMGIGCKNLLSRLDNSNSSDGDVPQEPETYEGPGMKLHQLLEPSHRADVVTTS